MVESLDEQQHQQKLQDAALVLIKDQVQIPMGNLRITLEKIQPDVIFKVCLEVLKQQSFYNAFIATADEPLPEDILGATTQRDTRSYYPKRYWELLPKEILGATTQRDTGMTYGKMDVT
ncbi:hypothetical protein Tco_0129447 [Tanacetum coccineum]